MLHRYDFTVSALKCNDCGCIRGSECFEDDGVCRFCPACGGDRVEHYQDYLADFVSVAVYETDRAWGGPEEGGWTYETGSMEVCTLRNFDRADYPQVQAYKEMLRNRYPEKRFAVRVYQNKLAPMSYPTQRPRYC